MAENLLSKDPCTLTLAPLVLCGSNRTRACNSQPRSLVASVNHRQDQERERDREEENLIRHISVKIDSGNRYILNNLFVDYGSKERLILSIYLKGEATSNIFYFTQRAVCTRDLRQRFGAFFAIMFYY